MFAAINCRLYLGSQVPEVQALGVERKTGSQGPCVRGRSDWRAGPVPSGVLPSSAGRSGRATPSSVLGWCQQRWGRRGGPPAGDIWQSWLQGPGGPPGRCPLGCVRPHGEASRNCGPQSQHLGFCPYPVPSAPLQPFTSLVPVCHSRVVPCQLANPRVQDGESQSEWPSAGL